VQRNLPLIKQEIQGLKKIQNKVKKITTINEQINMGNINKEDLLYKISNTEDWQAQIK
jgi:hypothetical protein